MTRNLARDRTRVKAASLPRWQTTAAWLTLGCAVVMLFGVWPLTGLDLWMHLTVGRWIWAHGWVPSTDPFSYITEGQPFLAHSWLAEVVLYLARADRRHGGAHAVAIRSDRPGADGHAEDGSTLESPLARRDAARPICARADVEPA